MKKFLILVVAIVFMVFMFLPYLYAQEPRIYNDGSIDFAPITASFLLSAQDTESDIEKIQYSVDGSDFSTYQSPISFNTEGRHIIVYRAIDKAGNISSEKIYSVVIDATAPDGAISVKGPVYIVGNNVYITSDTQIVLWAEDKLSGVDSVYVKIDNAEYMPYSGPVTISEEGEHTASSYAIDNVGNKTEVYSLVGYVDNSGPDVTINHSEDFVVVNDTNYTNKNNEFSIASSDNLSGVKSIEVSVDGSPYIEYTSPFKIQDAGNHTIEAKAVDNLGNESEPVSIDFYVDVKPPETTIGGKAE